MCSTLWTVKLTRHAEKDLRFWYKTNKSVYQKCLEILNQLETDPTNLDTVGQPEWLKKPLSGCMSRRITERDRCVYEVLKKERIIKVLQMRFHYDDH